MQLRRFALLTSTLLTSLLVATAPAHATEPTPSKTSLVGLVEDGSRFVTAAMAGNAPSGRTPSTEGGEPVEDAAPPPLVDFVPRASLVARDWRGSLKVAGRSMLIDDLRPSASTRMVLARIASDARLSPFVQVGAGQWRVDPVLFPALPSHMDLAGQIGAGFELRTASGIEIGGEAQYTFLYREGPASTDDVSPQILAVVVAAQTHF